jgi:hypothetical protein
MTVPGARGVQQGNAGDSTIVGTHVYLLEVTDYDDEETTQYLFWRHETARQFVFAMVRDIFGGHKGEFDNLTLDMAEEFLGESRKGFVISDWWVW